MSTIALDLSSVSTQLLYTTVRITATLADGRLSIGTGFFFQFNVDEQRRLPVLVTNKHVVVNAVQGTFVFHEAIAGHHGNFIPSSSSIPITINSFEQNWIGHPGDVDLCAMPVEPLRQRLHSENKNLFHLNLDESLIPPDEMLGKLQALEDVVMVGYPIGLWDDVNNFPLLRRGITATHPYSDFAGKPIGAVDIAAFPGSSGSPVLIANQGSYATPQGITIGSRVLLLGILAAGPQFTAEGQIKIVDIPTANVPIVSTSIPIHLGYYIKAKELLVLKQHLISLFGTD